MELRSGCPERCLADLPEQGLIPPMSLFERGQMVAHTTAYFTVPSGLG